MGKSPCFGLTNHNEEEQKLPQVAPIDDSDDRVRAFNVDSSISSDLLMGKQAVSESRNNMLAPQHHSVTADSSMLTTTSHLNNMNQNPPAGLTIQ